jgi:glycosyltransferase involved in cell wall biosynthesis
MDHDPRPGSDRLLAVIGEYEQDGTATGVQLRTRALVSAMRAALPTDVVAVGPLRQSVGCVPQCATCAADTVPTSQGRIPFPFNWNSCQRAAEATADVVRRTGYRAVLVSDLALYRYALAVRAATPATLVVDLHNADADMYEGMCHHPQWTLLDDPVARRMAAGIPAIDAVERQVIDAASVVAVPSAEDAGRLTRRHGLTRDIEVLPNCVPVPTPRPTVPTVPTSCVFIGLLGFFSNMMAALEIAEGIGPAIRAAVAGMRVVVAGRTPPPAIAGPLAAGGVELVGDPPEVAPLLRDAIAIMPMRFGGGPRLKILEAFAAGTPVVSTRKGMEGIAAEPYRHYLPAEDAAEFGAAVRRIVDDPALDLQRRQAAWDLVTERYSVQALSGQIPTVLRL